MAPLAPRGGMRPPQTVTTPSGCEIDLLAIARAVCRAYDGEFPDDRERYGRAGAEWCVHDNQHLLNWAGLSLRSELDFDHQLAWLARVLEARGFPLERLARNLVLLAGVVAQHHPDETDLHARLLTGADTVRSRHTFLTDGRA